MRHHRRPCWLTRCLTSLRWRRGSDPGAGRVCPDVKPGAYTGSRFGIATAPIAVHDRKDPLALEAARLSVKRAYDMAKVKPQDISFFELHDAFTIMSALSLEASGFAERGQGVRLALDGEITLQGRLPIATMAD